MQSTLRSLVIAGIAIALARPSWVTTTSKVATIALVDVSDSISDKQLAAAKQYVDELDKAKGDGSFQVIAFAEKPVVVKKPDRKAVSSAIERHANGGAGTDIQAAMQLAYGMFPQGYHRTSRWVISDGNQTQGDVSIESVSRRKSSASKCRGRRSRRTRRPRSASSA